MTLCGRVDNGVAIGCRGHGWFARCIGVGVQIRGEKTIVLKDAWRRWETQALFASCRS